MTQKPSEFLRASTHGYTIFELVLVFVILALLVGATLVGKDMIRASELRAVSVEKNMFETAINSFEAKFHQLPGDMPNAWNLWGDGNPPTNACGTNTTTASTGCNGNGDGIIDKCDGENIKAWEQLQLAGILEGTYDGTGLPPNNPDPECVVIKSTSVNSPASKLPSGSWAITPKLWGSNQPKKLYLMIGDSGSEKALPYFDNFRLSRMEAQSIDKKNDDGAANTGLVRGLATTGCNDDVAANGLYGIIEDPDKNDCVLQFVLDTE